MSRRKDGSAPPTAVAWNQGRYVNPRSGPVGVFLPHHAQTQCRAMLHWIRRGEPDKAGDMARALFPAAHRVLMQTTEPHP
jgi:hypothetical protein